MRGWGLENIIAASGFERTFRVVLPDGREVVHGLGEPVFTLHFKTTRAVKEVLARSSLGFGEAYTRGEIDVDGDLQQVVLLSFELREQLLKGALWERLRYFLETLGRRNTVMGSQKNIAAHYDLDNSFYGQWLDEEMQYTCAYFEDPTESLEVAQRRKMDLVCRKLSLRPGELVVEAGGGWGGLALHMARRWGVRVKSFNISRAQVEYARARAERLGVSSDHLEYILDDYRNIPAHVDRCDKFVSICMLEHVGRERYPGFQGVVRQVLRQPGLALVQFISRLRPSPIANPWLEKHVFPGYYNPSLGELLASLEAPRLGLQVIDVENMRPHYALTLGHWLTRLESHADAVRRRWGEETLRTFQLYLAGCLADFSHGKGSLVYQVLLSHGHDPSAPLTRFHHLSAESRSRAPRLAATLEPAFVHS